VENSWSYQQKVYGHIVLGMSLACIDPDIKTSRSHGYKCSLCIVSGRLSVGRHIYLDILVYRPAPSPPIDNI